MNDRYQINLETKIYYQLVKWGLNIPPFLNLLNLYVYLK